MRMTTTMPASRAGDGEGGFTLVEMLVALTISGIVAASIVSLLVGQSRFYNHTDDQLNAEQVAQVTFDLLSTEARMASGADLLAARSDSLAFRFDVLQAVVCDAVSSSAAAVYVFDRAASTGLTGSFVGVAVSDPYQVEFAYADGWNPTPAATGSGPKSDCTSAGVPGMGSDDDYMELSGWTSHFAAVPQRGALVRAYGQVSYRIAASTFFASRSALWRGTQELVGPFDDDAAFSYLMVDGSVESAVSASDLEEVVAVRFTGTAVGDGANRYDVSREIEFEVPFRN